jgi:propanol-preferring alcohol dehydrogenase
VRRLLSAVLQAITWSSMAVTAGVWCGAGLNWLKFSKSVISDRVAAIARGGDKAELAKRLGADHYIDSTAGDPGEALRALGGASAIIATAASGASMSPLVSGLAPRGQLVVVGAAPDPMTVGTADLIFGTRTITGSLTGSAIDNEDNLAFAVHRDIRPWTEVLPFTAAPDAYLRMLSGQARFRIVLDMSA